MLNNQLMAKDSDSLMHQKLAKELLDSSIKKGYIAPSYLFSGPKGVGQEEMAINFLSNLSNNYIKKLGRKERLQKFNHPDLLWIEPTFIHENKQIKESIAKSQGISNKSSSKIRLEQIKEIKRFLANKPIESSHGMIVIEDAEKMNESASNALLKTLEEPMNGLIILISSQTEKLLSTIKSRCQEIPFKGLGYKSMKKEFKQYTDISSILHYEEILLSLSNGSPKLLTENIEYFQEVPNTIFKSIEELSQNNLESLDLAKTITDELNLEYQLWLVKFLQQKYWDIDHNIIVLNRLDKLYKQISSSIQPRIAWEIALIELTRSLSTD